MSAPFDPSTLSVKKAASKLAGLDESELEALRDAELDGKNRITLITEIDARLSDLVDEESSPAVISIVSLEPVAERTVASGKPREYSRLELKAMRDACIQSAGNSPIDIGGAIVTSGPTHALVDFDAMNIAAELAAELGPESGEDDIAPVIDIGLD